jgi:hypothetical protein
MRFSLASRLAWSGEWDGCKLCCCGPTAAAGQYILVPSNVSGRIKKLFRFASHLSLISVPLKNVGLIYSFTLCLTMSVAHNMQRYARAVAVNLTVCLINYLNTAPWRCMGKWRHSSTILDLICRWWLSDQLHDLWGFILETVSGTHWIGSRQDV